LRSLFAVGSELSGDALTRTYTPTGEVFFASAERVVASFDFKEMLDHVVIEVRRAHFWDISAVAALDRPC
jgi:SulP family sulfate permease